MFVDAKICCNYYLKIILWSNMKFTACCASGKNENVNSMGFIKWQIKQKQIKCVNECGLVFSVDNSLKFTSWNKNPISCSQVYKNKWRCGHVNTHGIVSLLNQETHDCWINKICNLEFL